MLSASNVQKINDQIKRELRTVDRFVASDEEKMAAIERVAELKKLLTPQPTRQEILQELAAALVEARSNPTPPQPRDFIDAFFCAIR